MVQHIYAYILHKEWIIDDTAFELITAARKIDPGASITAIVAGSGANLDAVCNRVAQNYEQVWKIDNEALSYPDAELIRKLLVRIIPNGSTILIPQL